MTARAQSRLLLGVVLWAVVSFGFAQGIELKTTFTAQTLVPNQFYPDLVVVQATRAGSPVAAQKIRARVIRSDALLYAAGEQGAASPQLTRTTNADGIAVLSVRTRGDATVTLDLVPVSADGQPVDSAFHVAEFEPRREFEGSFNSRRLFTEVFIGATFTNDYDEQGNSTGFAEASPLARVSFDTVWADQRRENEEAPLNFWRRSLFHTGLEVQLADFPFGPAAGDGDGEAEENSKGLDDAFSGTIYGLWQPDEWASYTPTSTRAEVPHDALRWGVFAKAGMTTRSRVEPSTGDTSFYRAQVGLKLTHHQTRAERAHSDQDNVVPMRFIELSFARFEEYAGVKDVNRFILDGGFRLPGLGSDPIPFYAGVHLNSGEGPDDLRIFVGFLFMVNEIANLFQSAGK